MTMAGLARAVLIALCVSSIACGGDGPTAPPVSASGSLSFSYSGAVSGTFDVNGAIGSNPSEGATAIKGGLFDGLLVMGVQMRDAARADFLDIILPPVTAPSVFSLSYAACTSLATLCPLASLTLDVQILSPVYPPYVDDNRYLFTTGNVTVTAITASRVTGTFEGSASTFAIGQPARVITITNGKFDVPIGTPGLNY